MAALTDATVVTSQLVERTRELRRYLNGVDADLKTAAFAADDIAALADALATTFDEIDDALNHLRLIRPTGAATVEPAPERSEVEPLLSPQPRRRLVSFLRPARWLGRRLRDYWRSAFRSRRPNDQSAHQRGPAAVSGTVAPV
jgi:hypothetical protein